MRIVIQPMPMRVLRMFEKLFTARMMQK